jgi:hypothetical protein
LREEKVNNDETDVTTLYYEVFDFVFRSGTWLFRDGGKVTRVAIKFRTMAAAMN